MLESEGVQEALRKFCVSGSGTVSSSGLVAESLLRFRSFSLKMSSSWAVFSGIEWVWPDLTPEMLMLCYQNHAFICACMRVRVYVYMCLLCLQKSQQALWGGNFDLLVLPYQFLPPSIGRKCQNVLAYFLVPGRCLAISGEQINMCEWVSEPIR